MFYAKTFAKMLQNIFANAEHMLKIGGENVKLNICKTFAKMF